MEKLTHKQMAATRMIDGVGYIRLDALDFHWTWERQKEITLDIAMKLVKDGVKPDEAIEQGKEFCDIFFQKIVKRS